MANDLPDVPIDLGHWLLALVPIILLLVLLAVFRWKAPEAGPLGMFAAVAVALTFFETPWETVAVGAGKGVWDAIFILFVVWPALLLYRVTDRAGAFHALREGITRFSRDDLFLIMAFGWVFASFLQGIAGFGTPIAVVAPLLIAIGVRPVAAVVIPLIGHAWANMFGTLAVGWLATTAVIDIDDPTQTAFQTAILLWLPNLAGGAMVAWIAGRGRGVRHLLPMIGIVSLIHGGGQLVLTLWDPVLSNFLAATAAMIVLYPLSRMYREDPEIDVAAMADAEERDEADRDEGKPVMGLAMAFMPYMVLTVASVAALVPPPVEEALDRIEVGLPFPEVDTGYDVVQEAEDPYSPFAPFTHPGTFLLLSTAVAWAWYRARGYFDEWAERQGSSEGSLFGDAAGDAVPASVAIVSFLVLSSVMGHSGQTDTLALGIAEVAPPAVFAFFSGWIGVLGAFMTSSNTASNVLFAPLQQTVADVEGLSESAIIAAQSTGGAVGNAIAPANIVLGTGTAGIVGQEGKVLRQTLPWTLGISVVVGFGTVMLDAWL